MRFRWPEETVFERLVLDVDQKQCQRCGARLNICDHRIRRIYTLDHPLEICCRLVHCSDPACPSRPRTQSSPAEISIAMPGWLIGWDVFCFIGHRRFARHFSVTAILEELLEGYAIKLSPDAISIYIRRYQDMVAARASDLDRWRDLYRDIDSVDLSIDGLQPEKGHETLYAVRELNAKRVWFAEALLSSNQDEVRRLLRRAREMADALDKPIRLWISDKQDAFVKGIAQEFPEVPHLYCANHFLRELAKPTMAKDSHAKVQMRQKVRGLRTIEREVLKERRECHDACTPQASEGVNLEAPTAEVVPDPEADPSTQVLACQSVTTDAQSAEEESGTGRDELGSSSAGSVELPELTPAVGAPGDVEEGTQQGIQQGTHQGTQGASSPLCVLQAEQRGQEAAAEVVLEYCAAVRGILNDDQGGPLDPPGLRMGSALREVRESLKRNLDLNKPGPAHGHLKRLAACIDRGLAEVEVQQQEVAFEVLQLHRVAQTLDVNTGTPEQRKQTYEQLYQEYERTDGELFVNLAKVMKAWKAGLILKIDHKEAEEVPVDNLDLERFFRVPKGHERRIHGHKHAGVRIVQEGPSLLMTLDTHLEHDAPFTAVDLVPYRHAKPSEDQLDALKRRKTMRKARSKKNDPTCSEN